MEGSQAYGFSIGGLSTEFTMLALAVVLGALHLVAATQAVTHEHGFKWNMGPRDSTPPLKSVVAGRLQRAFSNFRETFPFFAVLVLALALLGRHSALTIWGSEMYLVGRILYLPLYAAGIPVARTVAWAIATIGICLLLAALFMAR